MRTQFREFCGLLASVFVLGCSAFHAGNGVDLDGAWEVTEVEIRGAGATVQHEPQASLVIFRKGYYSWSRVTTPTPRVQFAGETPTDAERLAAYESILFNTGKFEADGSTLTLWPVVARSPNFSGGAYERFRYQLSGDTLRVEQSSEDVYFRVGDKLRSPSVAREIRLVLRRLP